MEHRKIQEIEHLADVERSTAQPRMSKCERLERWAELLERQGGRRLRTLEGTEFGTRRERDQMRADGSPLTVAFQDPVLREEGLRSDRLGDALDFFGLSDAEAHHIFCHCYYGPTMSAHEVAARVRIAAAHSAQAGERTARFRTALGVGAAGTAAFLIAVL